MISSLATVFAIAIASNLDNAGVGIAYGVRKIQISWLANLLIATISAVATYVSGFAGEVATHYISTQVATWTGAIVIMLVGLWVLGEPWRNRRKEPKKKNVMSRILRDPVVADFDKSESISLLESCVLGVALAINALAGGFDAGIEHIGILWTALLVGLFSYGLLGLAAYLGRKYAAESLGDKATYIAGFILIIVGIHQVW